LSHSHLLAEKLGDQAHFGQEQAHASKLTVRNFLKFRASKD
jgi:hypothetical protein